MHEEVSNWAKPGFPATHNHRYWTDASYYALGLSACGYLSDFGAGKRWQNAMTPKAYINGATPQHEARDLDTWLIETIGSALRTCHGVDLAKLARKSGRNFTLTPNLQRGLDEGKVSITDSLFKLKPSEWFLENAWAVEVISAFGSEA